MPRFKGYVGVRKSVSKRLRKSADRVASTIRRAAFDTVKRGIVGSSVLGLAGSVAATVFEGTRRVLNFDAMDPSEAARKGAVEDPNAGGYSQRKRVDCRFGSSLGVDVKKRKIIGAHLQPFIDRFNAAKGNMEWTPGELPGMYALDYFFDTAAPNPDPGFLPYYLMDLTGAFRNYGTDEATGAQQLLHSVPLMRMRRNAAGVFTFSAASARNADDSADVFDWQIERSPISSIYTQPRDRAFYDWVDIRLFVWGARAVPVNITVQLIQFTDDRYVPGAYAIEQTGGTLITTQNDSSADTTSANFLAWQDFWLSETDKLIGNPITKRGTAMKDVPYTVIGSRVLKFEPIMTTEGDGNPHGVEFHARFDMSKVVDYTWAPHPTGSVTNAELGNPNEWLQYLGNKSQVVAAPKARVYLKICGETPCNVFQREGPITDVAGSFDIIVRRKHTVLVSGS